MKIKNLVLAVIFLAFCSIAQAEDFGTAMGIASLNIPAGADVAGMGNAWVAAPLFSSKNPAVVGQLKEDSKAGASVSYGLIHFGDGPDIQYHSESVLAKIPYGFLQVTFSDGRSGKGAMRSDLFGNKNGEKTKIRLNSLPSLNIQYGFEAKKDLLMNGDKLILGISADPYSTSKISFSQKGNPFLVSESKGYSLGTGFLYQANEKINFGGFYSYSHSRDKDKIAGLGTERSDSESHQLRLGASWQILPMTFIACDWQHLNIDGKSQKDQVFAGVEQGIIKDILYVYGGYAADGPTVGLGVYLKHGGVNIGYMNNPFKDTEKYLGKAQVLTALVYFNF